MISTTTDDDTATIDLVQVATGIARQCQAENGLEKAGRAVDRGLALRDIVSELGVDQQITAAAIIYPLLERGLVSRRTLKADLPDETISLARDLLRLGSFRIPENWNPEAGLDEQQAETLRKMLLSIIEDVRLILVRLADQLHRLRNAKKANEPVRRQIALETREIYAPLANKLGVWQLKWELEDLSFRFLEPETYKKIAKLLKERRVDREVFIREVVEILKSEAAKLGIAAEVAGRPKHIFSIWKKMQRKQLGFERIFDVRAIRVLVDTVADCYAVLGAVHGRWPPVPGEFDDYIATPKGNGYRSLHTAVVGPGKNTLEIQIRTKEMHAHAELGVAAHWKYKEGKTKALTGSDATFEKKIRWVRSLLDPPDPAEQDTDFIDRFKADLFEDRVYVTTPQGDIVDLPSGATPLDFAYYVHTALGHRCRGAKLDGRIVPLTHKLTNGAQVQIITAKAGHPSRDWLIPQLGYLATTRARAKARAWFRHQDRAKNLDQGKTILEKELSRLGASDLAIETLARDLRINSTTDLYVAIGSGEISVANIAEAVQKRIAPPQRDNEHALQLRKPAEPKSSGIDVEGVGGLMTTFARCCRPVPPDPIAGYITLGRGVTIHRQHCANLLRLADRYRERVLEVNWGSESPNTYPVDITIDAHDRKGLVKDISSLLAAEKTNIVGMNTTTDKATLTAHFELTLEISGLEELSRIMLRISNLPNIVSVNRRK